MPVVVPSAPEVQETTRMLEDSESVSSQGRPAGRLSWWQRHSVLTHRWEADSPSGHMCPERPTVLGLCWRFGLALALLDLGLACLTSPATAPPTPTPTTTFL